jgi:RNA-directed DNA polymerase
MQVKDWRSARASAGNESPADTEQLMEEVCGQENCQQALRRVKANKGSPGVDGMNACELADYLKQHWPAIREQLLSGIYQPEPDKGAEIDKPDEGGVIKLAVLDRFIQQAVLQVLQKRWDRTFSDLSYGFRPGRSAQGVLQCTSLNGLRLSKKIIAVRLQCEEECA